MLTGGCQHLFASKDSVCTSHETHGLFRFSECAPSGGQSNHGSWQNNTCRGNGPNQGVIMHGLDNSNLEYAYCNCVVVNLLASLASSGVPGIGTSALTGKDSGCSGML